MSSCAQGLRQNMRVSNDYQKNDNHIHNSLFVVKFNHLALYTTYFDVLF